jgi:hypothetical protein
MNDAEKRYRESPLYRNSYYGHFDAIRAEFIKCVDAIKAEAGWQIRAVYQILDALVWIIRLFRWR